MWANICLGKALMDGNKPDEAIRYFQAVVALRPRLLIGYHYLGGALGSFALSGAPERFDEAIAQLRKALAIDPNSVKTHLILIGLLWGAGRHDEAIAQSRIALRFDDAVARARASLGTLLYLKGRVEESLPEFRRAVSLEPDHPEMLDEYRAALRKARGGRSCGPSGGRR